mmetsp:Transcript_25981/g.56954  ORF Transcript_25981/g.56954 Transcript_25981/m.56954 type:complete len:244 (-) Transcript_25981:1210-1941(-)|eukprot:CAMPEP_0168192216 /NCGR_PEP_ID=MMETSP0139_2-20121125/17927_1 /TAXON_ID=44445 /ORGANISM="Pseudo-nitzschia australis, Strain 10249 10 AB" /LENGTH=243 /DNA_ID=CAMNT_0008115435 /DNA_START=531 /DNA_END=1262 /DNA_ORIENTATION=+
MKATKPKSPLLLVLKNPLISIHIITVVIAVQTIFLRFAFVVPLAAPRIITKQHSTACNSRREVLSSLVSSVSKGSCATVSILATATLTTPIDPARAAIDVSGLKVENPTATDIFLGNTYYPDDDVDREGVDGRISRMKYSIELASAASKSSSSSSGDFLGLVYRPIKVKGSSSAISSSRDDFIELSGTIFRCSNSSGDGSPQGGQCITIDFSPMGGPKDVQGYWDETEKGIRFVRGNKVWSKQ